MKLFENKTRCYEEIRYLYMEFLIHNAKLCMNKNKKCISFDNKHMLIPLEPEAFPQDYIIEKYGIFFKTCRKEFENLNE